MREFLQSVCGETLGSKNFDKNATAGGELEEWVVSTIVQNESF